MSLPCKPKAQYGYDLESTFEPSLPMFPWNRGRSGEGGSDTAASGIPEAFVIRRDYVRWFRLRILESEMDAWDTFLNWAQDSGEPFNFWLDRENDATEHSVYLHSLRWEDGEEVQHERDGQYLQLFVVSIALRTSDGGQWLSGWADLAIEGAES